MVRGRASKRENGERKREDRVRQVELNEEKGKETHANERKTAENKNPNNIQTFCTKINDYY